MAAWGQALFGQIFVGDARTGSNPQIFYHEAVREGLEGCQLCITSEAPAFLNIPWELLRDPTPGRGYLAPSLGGLFRQRVGQRIEATREPAGPLRILLVIARPYGDKDVALGTVARLRRCLLAHPKSLRGILKNKAAADGHSHRAMACLSKRGSAPIGALPLFASR